MEKKKASKQERDFLQGVIGGNLPEGAMDAETEKIVHEAIETLRKMVEAFNQTDKGKYYRELCQRYDMDKIHKYSKKYFEQYAGDKTFGELLEERKTLEKIYGLAQKDYEAEKGLKDYRVSPPEKHRVANDVITNTFFDQTAEQMEKGLLTILDSADKRKDKGQKVVTKVEHGSIAEAGEDIVFDAFDKAVFMACYSEMASGNLAVSFEQLLSHMTGGTVRKRIQKPKRKRKNDEESHSIGDEITESIMKLSGRWVKVSIHGEVFPYWWNDAEIDGREKSQLVYAKIKPLKINGKMVEGVEFWGESALVKVAKAKGQILAYPSGLLAVPVSASRESIIIREELLNRIANMKYDKETKRKSLNRSIVLGNIPSLGYNEKSKRDKSRIRGRIEKMMNYWKEEGYISGYEWETQGREIVSIIIKP